MAVTLSGEQHKASLRVVMRLPSREQHPAGKWKKRKVGERCPSLEDRLGHNRSGKMANAYGTVSFLC